MKKFIVETYYTCVFKTVHTLDNLNDKELAKIDSRSDGEVQVIDVKLNSRKTKKIGNKKEKSEKSKDSDSLLSANLSKKIDTSKNVNLLDNHNLKTKNQIYKKCQSKAMGLKL